MCVFLSSFVNIKKVLGRKPTELILLLRWWSYKLSELLQQVGYHRHVSSLLIGLQCLKTSDDLYLTSDDLMWNAEGRRMIVAEGRRVRREC